jgi:hypothetical protein
MRNQGKKSVKQNRTEREVIYIRTDKKRRGGKEEQEESEGGKEIKKGKRKK